MTSQGIPSGAAEAHPPTRAAACVGAPLPQARDVPPPSNTGAHLTFHWLRGGIEAPVEEVVELVADLTGGGYSESHEWGRYFYRKHHEFVAGLRVYFEPVAANMPAVMVDAPGEACEFLGLERLRTLFCNAELARADVALDRAPFTPAELASEVRRGNVRCKSKQRHYTEDLGDEPDGNTLTIGSRSSHRFLRIYDGRGFTRVELELKGRYARAMKGVLLADLDEIAALVVGVVRDFVDFVDVSKDSNPSRAPLLPAWRSFTEGLARVRLPVEGTTVPTADRIRRYIEHQVAASLYTYCRLGYSLQVLLDTGKRRLRPRHRSVLTYVGAPPEATQSCARL